MKLVLLTDSGQQVLAVADERAEQLLNISELCRSVLGCARSSFNLRATHDGLDSALLFYKNEMLRRKAG